jgi:hypothetical protein
MKIEITSAEKSQLPTLYKKNRAESAIFRDLSEFAMSLNLLIWLLEN